VDGWADSNNNKPNFTSLLPHELSLLEAAPRAPGGAYTPAKPPFFRPRSPQTYMHGGVKRALTISDGRVTTEANRIE